MSNIDEQLSAHTRRRIPYNEIAGIIDRVIDYDITPSWYDDKGDFIDDVCDYIVDYFNEDDHIELTPKDKDAFYYYLVDTYGEYLSNYYDQWKKGVRGSLSEQSNRIKSMMGVINENKLTNFFHKRFDKIFDGLELIKTENNLHQYNWVNNDGKKVFERNNWGRFWIYGCDEYYHLKIAPKSAGLSFIEFQEILINYLNNKYSTQFGDEKPLKEIGNETCDEY